MKRVRRVLVVEGDRERFATLLANAGYDVQAVATGLGALRTARASPPDVIVLDLIEPVMNAWDFRCVQRADPELARVPVVALSARIPGHEIDLTVRVLVEHHELRTLLRAFRAFESAAVLVPLRGGREEN